MLHKKVRGWQECAESGRPGHVLHLQHTALKLWCASLHLYTTTPRPKTHPSICFYKSFWSCRVKLKRWSVVDGEHDDRKDFEKHYDRTLLCNPPSAVAVWDMQSPCQQWSPCEFWKRLGNPGIRLSCLFIVAGCPIWQGRAEHWLNIWNTRSLRRCITIWEKQRLRRCTTICCLKTLYTGIFSAPRFHPCQNSSSQTAGIAQPEN